MEENIPLISIIIPIYNSQDYLKKCIDSVINQTYKNIEIILVNDGSSDNSANICNEYKEKDNRIVVVHKENGGVSSARNCGLQLAKGEWITFVDSDDWIENKFIEVLIKEAFKSNTDVVFSSYYKVYNKNIEKMNTSGKIQKYSSKEFLIKVLNVQTSFGLCFMKLIRKDIIQNITFENELVVAEDALFNIKLCDNAKTFLFIPSSLYYYRINSNSVVRRFDTNYDKKYLKSMIWIEDFLRKKYPNNNNIQNNLYNFIAYHIMLIAVNYCYNPLNPKKGLKLLKEVCNYKLFKEAIQKSNYNELSLTRKITLFTLKHKLYFLTGLICKIRQARIN